MGERRVVYDSELAKQQQGQLLSERLSGSVAAIVGNMILKTEGFSIHNETDRRAARTAFEELMGPWFNAVLKAQATLGRDKFSE